MNLKKKMFKKKKRDQNISAAHSESHIESSLLRSENIYILRTIMEDNGH